MDKVISGFAGSVKQKCLNKVNKVAVCLQLFQARTCWRGPGNRRDPLRSASLPCCVECEEAVSTGVDFAADERATESVAAAAAVVVGDND